MSILKNAVDSIALGLEDYETSIADERRIISCTRNIYAGILLLFKHKLSSLSDPNTDEALIKERVNPKVVDNKILWVGKGKKTVDYQNIKDRFESLSINVDWNRINKINDYRNNIEHYFSTSRHEAVQGWISDSFIIIRDFISEQLKEDPKDLLGSDSWTTLVAVHEVYEREKADCTSSLETLGFFSETILDAFVSYSCKECGSDLIYPDELNKEAIESQFVCKACDVTYSYEEIVSPAIEDHYYAETYLAMKDGGDSPIADCPFCGGAYLYEEKICAECGESAVHECELCGNDIPPEELSEDSLCGCCSHIMSKND
ncbi:MAG: hypothetical protein Q7T40_12365 [Methylobacter sp.]|nr:hypothetical protein [Methylobacter sp.]